MLREKAGLSVPERRQTLMKAKKAQNFFEPVSPVWEKELRLAGIWDFSFTLTSLTCLKPREKYLPVGFFLAVDYGVKIIWVCKKSP